MENRFVVVGLGLWVRRKWEQRRETLMSCILIVGVVRESTPSDEMAEN